MKDINESEGYKDLENFKSYQNALGFIIFGPLFLFFAFFVEGDLGGPLFWGAIGLYLLSCGVLIILKLKGWKPAETLLKILLFIAIGFVAVIIFSWIFVCLII